MHSSASRWRDAELNSDAAASRRAIASRSGNSPPERSIYARTKAGARIECVCADYLREFEGDMDDG